MIKMKNSLDYHSTRYLWTESQWLLRTQGLRGGKSVTALDFLLVYSLTREGSQLRLSEASLFLPERRSYWWLSLLSSQMGSRGVELSTSLMPSQLCRRDPSQCSLKRLLPLMWRLRMELLLRRLISQQVLTQFLRISSFQGLGSTCTAFFERSSSVGCRKLSVLLRVSLLCLFHFSSQPLQKSKFRASLVYCLRSEWDILEKIVDRLMVVPMVAGDS